MIQRSIGAILVVASLISCGCGRNDEFQRPKFKPGKITAAAISKYDSNGDGVISGDELDSAPEMKAALAKLDENGDKSISPDEIKSLFTTWAKYGSGSLSAHCTVTQRDKPVQGANIVFQPADFLADVIPPAKGVTDEAGYVDLRCDALPDGMMVGLYRIEVSCMKNGKETIPAKYNTETVLGAVMDGYSPAIATASGLQIKLD